MKINLLSLANPSVFDIQPYQPGKPLSECKKEFGLTHFVRLSSNENPLGPSPRVLQVLASGLNNIARYPDANCYDLRSALSEKHQLDPDNVIIGNGSEELLRLILQAFVVPGQEVIIGQYAFMGYEIFAKCAGAHVVKVPMPEWRMDFDEVLKAITPKTKIVMLANPNNPTGTYVTAGELKDFLNRLNPKVLVVCDEAYYEYMTQADYPQTVPWLKEYPNLIITRTFSKAYALAGLRVGYAFAHEDIIAIVNRLRQPFNVNTLVQATAIEAMKDNIFLQYSVEMNERHKQSLYRGLSDLGMPYMPSVANFMMVQVDREGVLVFESLLRLGVIVRPMRYYQLYHHIRVSVGLEEENKCFLGALKQVLAKEKVA